MPMALFVVALWWRPDSRDISIAGNGINIPGVTGDRAFARPKTQEKRTKRLPGNWATAFGIQAEKSEDRLGDGPFGSRLSQKEKVL
jgi:hypothetical protein